MTAERIAGAGRLVCWALLVTLAGCDEQPTPTRYPDLAPPIPGPAADGGVVGAPDRGPVGPAVDQGPPTADAAPALPSLRIAAISDLNGSYGSTTYGTAVHGAVAALTGRIKPDLVLIVGDMVAGQQAGLDYEAMWAGFHAAVTDPLQQAGIPVAVTPGNHDASGYASFAGERKIYVDQWKPRPPQVDRLLDASDYPLSYSFVHRGVLFLSLDATTIGPLGDGARGWVDQQLAGASAHPLRIVFGHLSIHSVTVGRETEVLGDSALEHLMAQHKVALYLSGHQHGYYPGAAGGLRQISVGCLGSGPRKLIGTDATAPLSLVVIEIDAGAVVSVEAYRGSDFDQVLPRGDLPASLSHGEHTLTRDDLAGF